MSDAILWGGVVYALGFGLFVKRRRVLDTPTAKALSAAIGRAELSGSAHGDPAERSLVTDTPCAYWEAELYRRVPVGSHGAKSMKRIARSGSRIGHFWLADESGRVPVLVEGAQWWLDGASKLRNRRGDAISERARQWVRAASGHDWSDGDCKLVEKRLEEGAPVYVLATLSAVPEVLQPPAGGKRRPRSVAQAIAFGFFDMFFKSAPSGDAVSQAIARVREADGAAEAAQARRELPEWLQSSERVAVWKGRRGDPFLIANCAENRLARLLATWGFATMGLGTVLILAGVVDLFK
jgi:hypothetical protein